MIRVLRVMGSGIYLRGDGSRTKDFAQAFKFPDIRAAIEFCREHGAKNLELILLVQGAQTLTIPMGEV